MHRHLLAAAFVLFACVPPAQAQWTVTGTPVPELAPFDDEMQALMTARDIPSGAIAVGWQGRLVLARGYSWNPGAEDIVTQPTSLFRLASVSKPITSTLVHRLIQDGRLSPDATIDDFIDLTPRPGTTIDPRLPTITVRNLLQMLGGFGDPATLGYDPVFRDTVVAAGLGIPLPVSHADVIRYQNGEPLVADPGTTYYYSNYGYKLLGRIVEAASGMPYARYAQRVMNPAGIWHLRLARARQEQRAPGEVAYWSGGQGPNVIDATGGNRPWEYGGSINQDTMDAYGGWVASAPELLRWLVNLHDPDAPDAILDADSIEAMFALPENFGGSYTPGSYYYAAGWAVRDYGASGRTTWHAGSLPSTATYVLRYRTGFDVVVLLNRRNETDPDTTTNAMDSAVFAAYAQIASWPAHDLFPQVLDTIMRDAFD